MQTSDGAARRYRRTLHALTASSAHLDRLGETSAVYCRGIDHERVLGNLGAVGYAVRKRRFCRLGQPPRDVCKQLRRWDGYNLAGYLVTPPYYVRPSQRGIIEFYTEIANTTTLPIIVYDIPCRTGVQIELATFRTLAQLQNIRAVKDCGGDARKTQALIADRQLQVLAGDDHMIFTTLCQGGAGAIAASAHLHPELFAALYQAVIEERLERAREIHHALAPMIGTLYAEPNPAPLKSVLAQLGRMSSKVRSPMVEVSTSTAQAAQLAYAQVSRFG